MFSDASSNAAPTRLSWFAQGAGALLVLLFAFGLQTAAEPPVPEPAVPVQQAALIGGTATAPAFLPPSGEQIYNTRCMSCHQMGGRGVPGTFPPLTGSEWVTGDKGRVIRILLHGLTGKLKVEGTTYSGVMPPWGGALDDEQLAAIATYVRTSFGNEASAITADEVAKVRAATKGHKKPWTAKELKQEKNLGIPGADSTGT